MFIQELTLKMLSKPAVGLILRLRLAHCLMLLNGRSPLTTTVRFFILSTNCDNLQFFSPSYNSVAVTIHIQEGQLTSTSTRTWQDVPVQSRVDCTVISSLNLRTIIHVHACLYLLYTSADIYFINLDSQKGWEQNFCEGFLPHFTT